MFLIKPQHVETRGQEIFVMEARMYFVDTSFVLPKSRISEVFVFGFQLNRTAKQICFLVVYLIVLF